jgi:hypothetical protein
VKIPRRDAGNGVAPTFFRRLRIVTGMLLELGNYGRAARKNCPRKDCLSFNMAVPGMGHLCVISGQDCVASGERQV